jgi:hypothetical protein
MAVDRTLVISKNPTKFFFDTVFDPLNAQRMTQAPMEKTNMRA